MKPLDHFLILPSNRRKVFSASEIRKIFRQGRVTLLEQQNSVEEMSRFCRYWANRYFSDSQICELLQKTYFQENLESHHEEFKQIIEHLNAFRVLCLTKVSSTGTDWINRSIEQHSPFSLLRRKEATSPFQLLQ